jgi:hypothetical protein
MIIHNVPSELQPTYRSSYPGYTSGSNMEEIYYEYFLKHKDTITTERIYLPVFWTSYYVTHGYGEHIEESYQWLESLDKTKKYFTVVQYAAGIYVQKLSEYGLDIMIFSAGGGGINEKKQCVRIEHYNGNTQHIFYGNKGDIDIPLMCNPPFPFTNTRKDIYCSFMGRLNTHKCRYIMQDILKNEPNYHFYQEKGFEEYKQVLNRSIFTLAPRGYGYTSFRIYEAIMAESIPIYIWEDKKILPFDDILDWSSFSIIVHSSEIQTLPDLIKNVNINEYVNTLKKIKHIFHFDETFKYMVTKLAI